MQWRGSALLSCWVRIICSTASRRLFKRLANKGQPRTNYHLIDSEFRCGGHTFDRVGCARKACGESARIVAACYLMGCRGKWFVWPPGAFLDIFGSTCVSLKIKTRYLGTAIPPG